MLLDNVLAYYGKHIHHVEPGRLSPANNWSLGAGKFPPLLTPLPLGEFNINCSLLSGQTNCYLMMMLGARSMQSDYSQEGVAETSSFSFPDNRHLLELFLAKRTGLLDLLDGETKAGGTDQSLDGKLEQRAEGRLITRLSSLQFAVAHYVGRVKYHLEGMVARNKDHITVEMVQTLRGSSLPLVSAMFSSQLSKTGQLPPNAITSRCSSWAGGSAASHTLQPKSSDPLMSGGSLSTGRLSQTRHQQTQGLAFRHALINMLYKLTHSTPHFVRCIRANMEESDTYDTSMVKHQVKYHALCDTITIRQQGFSHRLNFDSFIKRYQGLAFDFDESVELTANNARLLLLRLKMEGWAIGSSRVFLKYYMEEYLSRLYEDHLRKVVRIQAMIRTYVQLKRIRAGLLRPKSKPTSPEPELMRKVDQEAANKIANRERFLEESVEGEAARVVQYYYRKWKMRTLFQALQIYRAHKMQQLVYFCQQVHLFSQECQSRSSGLSAGVSLGHVVPQRPGSHQTLLAEHTACQPPKLALDHTLAVYFDTSYLCHPSRDYRQQDDDWEGPFKSRLAAQRASNMGSSHPFSSTLPVPSISTSINQLDQDNSRQQQIKSHMDKENSQMQRGNSQIQRGSSQQLDRGNSEERCNNSCRQRNNSRQRSQDDEDQFKDLKEQIAIEQQKEQATASGRMCGGTSPATKLKASFDEGLNSYAKSSTAFQTSVASKQMQTSFEVHTSEDCNAHVNNISHGNGYASSSNSSGSGQYGGMNSGSRGMVYKSKRPESREKATNSSNCNDYGMHCSNNNSNYCSNYDNTSSNKNSHNNYNNNTSSRKIYSSNNSNNLSNNNKIGMKNNNNTSNSCSNIPAGGGRNSYNRFAGVTPASRSNYPLHSHYNFSYIKPAVANNTSNNSSSSSRWDGVPASTGGCSGRPPVTVSSWQDRNRASKPPPAMVVKGSWGAERVHNTPEAALFEMQQKARKHSGRIENEIINGQDKLRKTVYARDSMKRGDAHQNNSSATYNSNASPPTYQRDPPPAVSVGGSSVKPAVSKGGSSVKPAVFIGGSRTKPAVLTGGSLSDMSSSLQRELSRESARSEEAERYRGRLHTAGYVSEVSSAGYTGHSQDGEDPVHLSDVSSVVYAEQSQDEENPAHLPDVSSASYAGHSRPEGNPVHLPDISDCVEDYFCGASDPLQYSRGLSQDLGSTEEPDDELAEEFGAAFTAHTEEALL